MDDSPSVAAFSGTVSGALSQVYSRKRICPATRCYYQQPSFLEFSAKTVSLYGKKGLKGKGW